MKKNIANIIIVITLVVIMDLLIGLILKPVAINLPDSNFGITNAKQALIGNSGEVLILGASRSNHHYDPHIIEDSLGMSVFNGGMDGTDVCFSWAVFQSALNIQKPEILIIDINAPQLNGKFKQNDLNYQFMYGIAQPYTKCYDNISNKTEKLKLLSNSYRFNSMISWFVASYIKGENANKGYKPLFDSDTTLKYKLDPDTANFKIDDDCNYYLNDIVKTCKKGNIKLVICFSPRMYKTNPTFINWISNYCNKNSILFINFDDDSNYTRHPEFFDDEEHMNHIGAEKFTSELVNKLNNLPF